MQGHRTNFLRNKKVRDPSSNSGSNWEFQVKGRVRAVVPSQKRIDVRFMREALAEARRAAAAEEVPVGAVIVFQGRVIARGRNRIRELKDPTAHAEVLAMRAAGQHLKSERLRETTLYTTLEPCALCAGGIVLARIPRVVFATADPKAGAAGSVMDLLRHSQLNHRADVTGGVLPGLSRQLLQRFFRKRRGRAY
jgi:tRNA(adenine34) deaminase